MRPRAAVSALLAGTLTGGLLIASGAAPAQARHQPDRPGRTDGTTVSVRLAPPVVTVGEPAAVVVRLRPVQRSRQLSVQRRVDAGRHDGGSTAWDTIAATGTDASGRAVVPLDTVTPGAQVLRVVAAAAGARPRRTSAPVTFQVRTEQACTPKVPLVDRQATTAARCLAARLDRWGAAGLMGQGQQLNMSSEDYLAPLDALTGRRVSVVGFDLEELARTGTYDYPFLDRAVDDLVSLAQGGAVLSASWHATNPHTGGSYADRGWHSLGALLDPRTQDYQRFWADVDAKLALLQRLQEAGVAVVLRPFHEANGGWFWWGHPDPSTYRRLWTALQARAAAAGVHDIVWAYSFAARTWSGIKDPVTLLPGRVDLAGIDAYDPEGPRADPTDRLPLAGWSAVARKVQRMTFTEAGPESSGNGAWNPAVVTRSAKRLGTRPLWAMLWFDDAGGRKQISSLRGGPSWLDSCPQALCYLR